LKNCKNRRALVGFRRLTRTLALPHDVFLATRLFAVLCDVPPPEDER